MAKLLKYAIKFLLPIVLLLGCQSNTKQKKESNLQTDSDTFVNNITQDNPVADTIKMTSDSNTQPGRISKRIPILEYYIKHLDSTKLIRVFENISFGLPEHMPIFNKEGYSLYAMPFDFSNPSYDKDFGLYAFSLKGTKKPDYKYLSQVMNDIISIINIKYGNPKKINRFIDDLLGDTFRGGEGPFDDGDIYYKYEWIKNGIRIDLGYQLGFRYEYEKELAHSTSGGMVEVDTKKISKSIKTFFPILNFDYIKISTLSSKKNNDFEKDAIKKEVGKF